MTRPYFLPYQVRWLQDRSRYKICEKSRRIGMTYAQSYEDVRDAARMTGGMDVWFSSADESAAIEYVLYCRKFAQVINAVVEDWGEVCIDETKDVRAFVLKFDSGNRINALTSNPTQLNSKGGKVILDEFAKHKRQRQMWAAAQPVTLHGYPMRIISTYEGKGNLYWQKVDASKRGKSPFKLHSTTIVEAVDQGLADLILKRKLTAQERAEWLREARQLAGDELTWRQEYMCDPVDEAAAWLPWDLIAACESAAAGQSERYDDHYCYVGMDIARRRDLTVIWVLEELGDTLVTREVVRLKNAKFATQEAELRRILGRYKVLRCCMDQTGMGEQMTERMTDAFGPMIEGILFNASAKQDMAIALKQRLEDRQLRIPPDEEIRGSLHSVRQVTTSAGNPRFDVDANASDHADYFWALALAVHGAGRLTVPVEHESLGVRESTLDLEWY